MSKQYKINIHAHTIFSDGMNSPYVMATKAKELGFSALVITDHYYGLDAPRFISVDSMRLLKGACHEARDIIPIIIGIEVPFMGQEVLIFGGAAVNKIIETGRPSKEELLSLKRTTGCGVVLCHPSRGFEDTADVVDSFEQYNSGRDMFNGGERSFGPLVGKQMWCNSDAHHVDQLETAYNLVNKKIETESDLIRYIKRQQQPDFCLMNK